jgi:hypothetical protein
VTAGRAFLSDPTNSRRTEPVVMRDCYRLKAAAHPAAAIRSRTSSFPPSLSPSALAAHPPRAHPRSSVPALATPPGRPQMHPCRSASLRSASQHTVPPKVTSSYKGWGMANAPQARNRMVLAAGGDLAAHLPNFGRPPAEAA